MHCMGRGGGHPRWVRSTQAHFGDTTIVREEQEIRTGTRSDVLVSSLGGAATVAWIDILLPRAPLLLGLAACSCVPAKDVCPSTFCISPAGL